jgi:hypothetical protein
MRAKSGNTCSLASPSRHKSMIVGVKHKKMQTCKMCREPFFWTPAVGLCPYCDLSKKARQTHGAWAKDIPVCNCAECLTDEEQAAKARAAA